MNDREREAPHGGQQDNQRNSSVSAFVDAIGAEERRADAKQLIRLMKQATADAPKMWESSIIGFGSYHYFYGSGREGDAPLVGFSPRRASTVFRMRPPNSRNSANIQPEKAVSASRDWPMWTRACSN